MEYRFHTAVTTIENRGEGGYRPHHRQGETRWTAPGSSLPPPFRRGVVCQPVQGLGIELINNQVDIGVRVELPRRGLRAHHRCGV